MDKEIVELLIYVLLLAAVGVLGRDVQKGKNAKKSFQELREQLFGKSEPPPAAPSNGNGHINGNGQIYASVLQSIDLESDARQSLEKRVEDLKHSIDEWREADKRIARERDDSWLVNYKQQEREKQALADTIQRYDRTQAEHAERILQLTEWRKTHEIHHETQQRQMEQTLQEILRTVQAIRDEKAA